MCPACITTAALAAFEQPALFTKELRDCFRSLR
jgi:hypothetical protein